MQLSRFPHPLVLIFGMIVIAQILTYVLPAGSYEREPQPSKGAAFVDRQGQPPLRERFAAALDARGLTAKQFAELLHVSEQTVKEWIAGPPGEGEAWRPGTHIEATVGRLLEKWIATGEPPSADDVAGWKAAMEGVRQRVVPGTYARIADAARVSWATSLVAILSGLQDAGDVIFFVFVVGGVIGVLRATGAIDAMIGNAIHALGGRPGLLVAGMTVLFAIGASSIGMTEEYMPFVPVLVTMALALRMDAIVAVGMVYIGAAIGYGAAALNPFTVLIAQGIAGLEPTSGWLFRVLFMVVSLAVGVHHLMRYAHRVRADPARSHVVRVDYSSGFDLPHDVALTWPRRTVIGVFVAGIVVFVVGVANWGWYFDELTAVFLGMALVAVAVCRMAPNRAAQAFCAGAAEMTTTALLIGFARTIEVVLREGQVIDTVIHGIAGALNGTSAYVAAIGMLGVQTVCNFFIPSGSGQAYVTMPIMAPLADLTAVTRQTAVLAYQIGDGFTNMLIPTNALLMGMLGLGRIPYGSWLKFIVPLMLKLYVVALGALFVAVAIGY